ncbi:MAG: zinc ribbon domain-containing protein [Geobacteraceae bacterium]
MKLKWEVDDANIVNAKLGGFGRNVITVNGVEVPGRLSLRKKGELPFRLSDGRYAIILINPQFATRPVIELRVDGQLMVESGKEPFLCGSCGTAVKPNDRFCGVCGQPMPPAEHYVHRRYVREATGAIKALAALFLIVGVIMFFASKSQVANVLIRLDGMNPNETFPKSINGVTYTVAALRKELIWEPWGILIQNLILAAIMAGLAFWGKRSPLAAVLIATAIYAVVIVTNAIINPESIGQGLYVKIIIIVFLTRGIKSALALRTADA